METELKFTFRSIGTQDTPLLHIRLQARHSPMLAYQSYTNKYNEQIALYLLQHPQNKRCQVEKGSSFHAVNI